ncbi:hypothetical protein MATR_30020 [Marivirga tractuosa]|uniref:Uncharacterized protein n=1 Tax=Marivirga tractuosa (strain ATCC 23168 / DSM 4126 / NBRC 15989 / NCIMB 1408 / VKM B-1430 / H-43) TaxID=643867 RepID=E4TV84_MARTH|nr:hypothetical protein Ftrac_3174 [Marivirga tractuosa DSM 4126]BDD16177.1 hypothetical protein MATR_30020 [Marivirga tractuosa]
MTATTNLNLFLMRLLIQSTAILTNFTDSAIEAQELKKYCISFDKK